MKAIKYVFLWIKIDSDWNVMTDYHTITTYETEVQVYISKKFKNTSSRLAQLSKTDASKLK